MRDEAGLTLEQLAKEAGWSIAQLSALENGGKVSARLKKKVREVLASPSGHSVTETQRASVSVKPPLAVHEPPAESDLTIWKRRAQDAERKLEALRTTLRGALDMSATTPVNSALTSEEESMLDEADASSAGEAGKP